MLTLRMPLCLLCPALLALASCDTRRPVLDASIDAPRIPCGTAFCGAEEICCGPVSCGVCVPRNSRVYCPPTCPDLRAIDASKKLDVKPAADSKKAVDSKATVDSKPPGDATAQTPCGPTLKCAAATQVCVVQQAWQATYACEPVPAGCQAQRTCACMGKTLCTGIFDTCMDNPGTPNNTITCECVTC